MGNFFLWTLTTDTIQVSNKRTFHLECPGKIRRYQEELAEPGLRGDNSIICAPTGSGKTLVAAMIIQHHLQQCADRGKEGKVLFITKTQQLARQQKAKLEQYIKGAKVFDMTAHENVALHVILPQVDIAICTAGKLRRELHQNGFFITSCTFILADECHHAKGASDYSDAMSYYLVEKLEKSSSNLPQVVGLTACLGMGRGRSVRIAKAIEHQKQLCAQLDTTGGVRIVTRHRSELNSIVPTPKEEVHTPIQRQPSDTGIQLFQEMISKLEEKLHKQNINPPSFQENPFAYQQWVQNELDYAKLGGDNKLGGDESQRILVTLLEYLQVYVLARITYEDFEKEHAVMVLQELQESEDHIPNENSIQEEVQLYRSLEESISRLQYMPATSNPLLMKVEECLFNHFSKNKESKAIFFVRDIKHTHYVTQWIKESAKLKALIRPTAITGHSRKGAITKEDQKIALEEFRTKSSDGLNLLVSTSVLEEGLDVPECNMVIRFNLMSNEISQVQAQGRARAEGGVVCNIIATDSMVHSNYLINHGKREAATEATKILSSTKSIQKEELIELQRKILKDRAMRRRLSDLNKRLWNMEDVTLHCSKCNNEICKASDVCMYGTDTTTPHYIIPSELIMNEKLKKVARKKPVKRESYELSRPFKIACVECSWEVGVVGRWRDGTQFPLLKCEQFTFCNTFKNEKKRWKKWKDVSFEVQLYEDYLNQATPLI